VLELLSNGWRFKLSSKFFSIKKVGTYLFKNKLYIGLVLAYIQLLYYMQILMHVHIFEKLLFKLENEKLC
jgi:hypothetical protein